MERPDAEGNGKGGDNRAGCGAFPQRAAPKTEEILSGLSGQAGHDAFLERIRDSFVRRHSARHGDQFALEAFQVHNSSANRRLFFITGYIPHRFFRILFHKYFSRAILAKHFFISARARNARTLTSGTDHPVIAEISFTDRSSISKS